MNLTVPPTSLPHHHPQEYKKMTANAKIRGKGYPWLVKSATRYRMPDLAAAMWQILPGIINRHGGSNRVMEWYLRNYYEKSAFRKSFLLCEAFCGSTGFHKSIGPFVVIF